MIRRILLSALLAVVLSCQNETAAPSAPQESTGALALRVVSVQALAPVESVLVRLTWNSGNKEMRKHWRDSSLQITGLPRKEAISVHMEGWSWVQGRRTVSWSGDTTTMLESGAADWNVASNTAVIRIVPVLAPSLSSIVPAGDTIKEGVLSVELLHSRTDTIRLDTAGVDTVFLGRNRLPMEGGKFLLVVSADTKDTVLVVGPQGQTSWFRVRVTAAAVVARLPQGLVRSHDTLRIILADTRIDTVKIDTAGIDSVSLGGVSVSRKEAWFPMVVTPTTNAMVRAVGHNGGVDSFRTIGSAKPLARDALVSVPALASWTQDTLRFEHDDGASDTISILAAEIDSVVAADSLRRSEGGSFRIVVVGARSFGVLLTGKAGQTLSFHVDASVSARIDTKPGLGARLLSPVRTTVGKICSLRVRVDSGDVSNVVLAKGEGVGFSKGTDSVWSLDWATEGSADSLRIHVYGKGRGGIPDTVRIGKKLAFDRQGPRIALPSTTMIVGLSGGSIAWSIADASGIDSVWFDGLPGKPCVDSSGAMACRADSVRHAFTIHARDDLGNDSQATVKVVVDSVAPKIDSVSIVGGRLLGKANDTVLVDSGTKASIRWKASDSLKGFRRWLAKNAIDGSERIWPKSGGWDTAVGLDVGTWTLSAQDSLGNATTWGTFVVSVKPAEIKPPVDTTQELKMELVALPRWVGDTVAVTIKRTAGRVDSIVWTGPKFATMDSTYWKATWTPAKGVVSDSIRIRVHGHTAVEKMSVHLVQGVNIDRAGPAIKLVLPAGQSGDTLRVARIAWDSLRVQATDTNRIQSVWLTGTNAVLGASVPGSWTARIDNPGDLMVHARDTLGNEDSQHVHVVFMPSVSDTDGPKLDSVVGSRGKLASTLIPRKDSAGRVGLRFYSREPSFVVKVWDGNDTIFSIASQGGYALVDSIPMKYTNANLNIGLFDSLGNLGDWKSYMVLPYVFAPRFSDTSGVYGSDRIEIDNGMEKFRTSIECPDSGRALRHALAGGWTAETYENGKAVYTSAVSYKYLCVDPGDYKIRSDTAYRNFVLLLRPEFKTTTTEFRGSMSVVVGLSPTNDTLAAATIQYCLGDSAACAQSGATWTSAQKDGTDHSFPLSRTTTVSIRVAFGGKVSHARYQGFTKLAIGEPTIYPKGGIMDYLNGYNYNEARQFYVSGQCSSTDGNSVLIWRDSGSFTWSTNNLRKDSTWLDGSRAMQFACVVGRDTSTIANHAYTLLKPPIIYPTNPSFAGDSIDITLAPWDGKPLDTTTTSYLSCVGPEYSAGNPAQRWCADGGQGWYDGREIKGGNFRVGLWYGETSQTVWSKIVYKSRQSISNKRIYTKQ